MLLYYFIIFCYNVNVLSFFYYSLFCVVYGGFTLYLHNLLNVYPYIWHDHITAICPNVKQMFVLLYRQLYNHTSPSTFKQFSVTSDTSFRICGSFMVYAYLEGHQFH